MVTVFTLHQILNRRSLLPCTTRSIGAGDAGTHSEPLSVYIRYVLLSGQGLVRSVFSHRPQYGILETGVSPSNRFEPTSRGGSNAAHPALSVPHLDVNADGR